MNSAMMSNITLTGRSNLQNTQEINKVIQVKYTVFNGVFLYHYGHVLLNLYIKDNELDTHPFKASLQSEFTPLP